MSFIAVALLLSLAASAFILLPLLRRRLPGAPDPLIAVSATLGLIVAALGLYAWVGRPYWSAPAGQVADQSIATLARHLEHQPDDRAGWLQLAQAYSALGNQALALRCYQSANRLAGGRDPAALAGMAEAMLMQDENDTAGKAKELLERALQLDPRSPKGLFYSAVIAFREGRLELAKQRFEAMLALDPPESVRTALQRQIAAIDSQLKPQADAATAIQLHVFVSPSLAARVPGDATLFVFVRAPGGGPPLAVKRASLSLPQDVALSAADAMVPSRAVQPGQTVSVVARISASGSPTAQSGDLYGEIRYVAGKSGAQPLQIDKLSP
jgi:cytochrome c-type biogenesis protein CcmH